jgi:type III pantothenate kinase
MEGGAMILAIDVGNTNTVFGLYQGKVLSQHWRVATSDSWTDDEVALTLRELFALSNLGEVALEGAILASVVPAAVWPVRRALKRYHGIDVLIVGPGLRTGMPILYENPNEVGADRIVNGVAAYDRYRTGVIVVDFGTAITFDCVTPAGEYLGGVIAPGVGISAEALYHKAAKLPRVDLKRPAHVVGRDTVSSIQSGLFYGYGGLVDGIVRRICAELDFKPRVIATGGQAKLIAEASSTIEESDELLTLSGLRLLYEQNRPAAQRQAP